MIIIVSGILPMTTTTTTTMTTSMLMGLERYQIHFREWFRSNWMGLVIFHQKSHYIVQLLEDVILTLNIWQIYALYIVVAGAH